MSYEPLLARTGAEDFTRSLNRFIAEAYSYFFASLAAMGLFGLISYHFISRSALVPLATADTVIWILCGWLGWRHPMRLVFPLFTVITGLLLGQCAHLYPNAFAASATVALITFAGLTAFVWISRWDFSFLRGFLRVAFFVLLGGRVASSFVENTGFLLGWTGFGVLTFAGWILYDTSNVMTRMGEDGNSAVAGFELILDIVGFHSWLSGYFNIRDGVDT